jgi:hypothetical protein
MYSLTQSVLQHLTVASDKPQAPATILLGNNPSTNCIECWVGPRADLDILEERKVSCPNLDSNSRPSSHSLVTIPTEPSWRMHGTINHVVTFICTFNVIISSINATLLRVLVSLVTNPWNSGLPVAWIWKGGIKHEIVLSIYNHVCTFLVNPGSNLITSPCNPNDVHYNIIIKCC